jgi:hypothetical protein
MSKKYKVLIPCRKGDKKPYKAGDVISGKEFTKAVINNWLEIGVLKEVDDGSEYQREG